MYKFKEILFDNRRFIIMRKTDRRSNIFGIFIGHKQHEKDFQILKIVNNTKQCREVIKNYRECEKDYLWNNRFFN